LKIETTPHENHQVKIVAEFDADDFAGYKRRAARKIAKKTKIPGFRPGKAPYDIVERLVGASSIQEEAVEILIDDQYANLLTEADVKPSGPGSLEEVISLDPPKFAFLVPLQPEVDLGDYKNIRLDYSPEEVKDEEVKDFLKNLQRNYSTAEPMDRPIQDGDLVYYKITAIDQAADEAENVIFSEKPVQIILGDDAEPGNWPFENFSNELIGLSEGQEKTIEHTYPQDDSEEEFSGKQVVFTIIIQSVKTLQLPELNDDFARLLGQFDDFAALEAAVREQLVSTKNQEFEDKYYTDLLEMIAHQATVNYPQFMVDEEIEHILQSVQKDLKQQNLDFETYLKLMKTDREKYIEENVRPAAEKRLVNSLIIDKFAHEEKIEIAKEDVESIMTNTRQMVENNPNPKGKKGKVSSQEINSVAYNAMTRLYNQRTLERMKFIASGEIDNVETAEELNEKPEDQLENIVVEEKDFEGTPEMTEGKIDSDIVNENEPEDTAEIIDDESEISEEE
jgi:trigger factor